MATLSDLQERLARVRSKERGYIAIQGICRILVALVVVIIAFFLLDWIVDLPYGARLLVAAVGFAFVAYIAYAYLIAPLRRIQDDDEMALRVEARNSDLRGRLISTLQLSRTEKSGAYAGSHDMIAALENETVRMADPLDFSRIVSTVMLKRLLIVALIVVAVKTVLVLEFPEYFKALAERLVNPEKQYPTRTRLSRIDVPEFVPRGEDIPVVVTVDPTSPEMPKKSGTLHFIQAKTGMNVPVELVSAGGNIFSGKLAKALEDVDLIVELNDVRSKKIPIHVLSRPEVDTSRSIESFRYTPPEYTKDPVSDWQKFGAITALQGSTAEIKFTATKPLKSAVIERSDGKKYPLTALPAAPATDPAKPREPEGLNWAVKGFPVDKSGTFHVVLTEPNGLTNSQPPLEYPIDARPDLAPTIKLVKPTHDLTVVPTAKPLITYNARDDYGLRIVWLVYYIQNDSGEAASRSDGSPTSAVHHDIKRIEYPIDADPNNAGHPRRELMGSQITWPLASINAKVGDQIVFWLECDDFCDTNDDAPRKTHDGEIESTPGAKVYPRTNDVKLTVISRQDKEAELRAELARLYQLVERSAKNQEELKLRVLEIQEMLSKLK